MKNPHNKEAEATVVAAVLTEPDVLPIVQEIVQSAEAFWHQELGAIYRAILSIRLSGRKISEVVIGHELVRTGDIKFIGSKADASQIMRNLVDEYGKGDYQGASGIVRDLHVRRRGVDDLRQAAMSLNNLGDGTMEVLENLKNNVAGLAAMANYQPAVHISHFVDMVLDELIEAEERPGTSAGITTGWEEVDAFFQLTPGRIYFIASRPGDGKTTAMMNMVDAAADAGANPFIQSLEMKGAEITKRVIMTRANVDIQKADAGETDDAEKQRISDEADRLRAKPIFVDEAGNLTPQDIRARVVESVRRHESSIAFIDHLHEVARRKPTPGERMSSIDAISEAVVVLADMAKELNIPVVCMAQMNREIEKGRKRDPVMSDLKGAGKIEERAYMVMFLHPRRSKTVDQDVPTDFIVKKNRTGETGTVAMIFEKDRGQFVPQVEDPVAGPTFNSWTEKEGQDGNPDEAKAPF